MLTQAVLASYDKVSGPSGRLTASVISPCPFGTYLNYAGLDYQSPDSLSLIRMEDGHYQETKMLDQLRKAGFSIQHTGRQQLTVHMGRSRFTGRPDGVITIGGKEELLEIKAMSLNPFTNVRQTGITPSFKCQVQLLMSSEELRDKIDGCWFYTCHKDSCRPFDFYEPRDLSYSKPIIEAVDAILLDSWIPTKAECDICPICRHQEYCWGAYVVDSTKVRITSIEEAEENFIQGKLFRDGGLAMMKEARISLENVMGEEDLLLTDRLRLRRVSRSESSIPIKNFVEVFGPGELPKVLKETTSKYIRITELANPEEETFLNT